MASTLKELDRSNPEKELVVGKHYIVSIKNTNGIYQVLKGLPDDKINNRKAKFLRFIPMPAPPNSVVFEDIQTKQQFGPLPGFKLYYTEFDPEYTDNPFSPGYTGKARKTRRSKKNKKTQKRRNRKH